MYLTDIKTGAGAAETLGPSMVAGKTATLHCLLDESRLIP